MGSISLSGTSLTVNGTYLGDGSYPGHLKIWRYTQNVRSEVFSSGGRSTPQVNIGQNQTITVNSGSGLYRVQKEYFSNASGWIVDFNLFFILDTSPPTVFTTVNRQRGGVKLIDVTSVESSPTFYESDPNNWDLGSSTYTNGTGTSYISWEISTPAFQYISGDAYSVATLSTTQTFTLPGTYILTGKAKDYLDVRGLTTVVPNEGVASQSFVVDPAPTSGPSGYLYTPVLALPEYHTLSVAIGRTDNTCDLSRWELLVNNSQISYVENSTNNYYYSLGNNLTGTNRNRVVAVKTYQINWTATSPATTVETHSAMSPQRTHNMLKRKNAPVEKRAAWLDGV